MDLGTDLDAKPGNANEVIAPIAGLISRALGISAGDYLALVERTGRQIHPGKRGGGVGSLPAALRRLGYNEDSWTGQVLGVGSAYPRAIGVAEVLLDCPAFGSLHHVTIVSLACSPDTYRLGVTLPAVLVAPIPGIQELTMFRSFLSGEALGLAALLTVLAPVGHAVGVPVASVSASVATATEDDGVED